MRDSQKMQRNKLILPTLEREQFCARTTSKRADTYRRVSPSLRQPQNHLCALLSLPYGLPSCEACESNSARGRWQPNILPLEARESPWEWNREEFLFFVVS